MLLEFDRVHKSFRDSESRVPVLQGVSFALEAGQTLALTGESGSGKSTLLHIASGLEHSDSGAVHLSGRNLTRMNDLARAALRKSEIALVFQQYNLIPSLSVEANIGFQARLAGKLDQSQIDRIVRSLDLTNQMGKYPEALSGGQQQRVAIARALAAKPKLLLADEPTGNLDEATADRVMEQMIQLVTETGAALLVVTHSSKVAARMDRRLNLHRGILA